MHIIFSIPPFINITSTILVIGIAVVRFYDLVGTKLVVDGVTVVVRIKDRIVRFNDNLRLFWEDYGRGNRFRLNDDDFRLIDYERRQRLRFRDWQKLFISIFARLSEQKCVELGNLVGIWDVEAVQQFLSSNR